MATTITTNIVCTLSKEDVPTNVCLHRMHGNILVTHLTRHRGKGLRLAVLRLHNEGITPNVVLRLGEPPLQQGAAPKMVLVPGTTKRMLLEGLGKLPCQSCVLVRAAGVEQFGLVER